MNNIQKNILRKKIIEAIQKKAPEIIRSEEKYTEDEILDIILELENRNEINFQYNKKSSSVLEYLFTPQAYWFWLNATMILFTFITTIMITEENNSLIYLRYIFGSILILFLPPTKTI